jgi:glycosyltransferase involved in cell wall biosynthesis
MIITVVTPTLNGMPYLKDCIASVKKNQSPDYEIDHVIVDGGSTDGTLELAEREGLRILTGKDKGIFDAINKGSFNSKGDLLGFLGSDDLMLEGALQTIARAHRQSNRRWIVGGIVWIDKHGNYLGELKAPPSWMSARMHVCLDWNPIMHMATYFTRDLFEELQGFNIEYKDGGDFDMFARALAKEPYERVRQQIVCFRRTGSNNSMLHWQRSQNDSVAVKRQFGPKSPSERIFWKYFLKAWLNGINPSWSTRKARTSLMWRLGFNAERYF